MPRRPRRGTRQPRERKDSGGSEDARRIGQIAFRASRPVKGEPAAGAGSLASGAALNRLLHFALGARRLLVAADLCDPPAWPRWVMVLRGGQRNTSRRYQNSTLFLQTSHGGVNL